MKDTQTSTTSKGIAAIRAIESEKPSVQRICFDPFARKFTSKSFYFLSKWFAGYGERHAPGTQGFLVCRYRYFDDYLMQSMHEGIKQLVILGAGLDSRGYRQDIIDSTISVFEVDQPATQADKRRRVQKIFGHSELHLKYVPIDFNFESLDKLLIAGFDTTLKTLFLWEGVTYYLSSEVVDLTLKWIYTNSANGSRIVFDYIYPSALVSKQKRGEIKRMQRYSRFTGEGLQYGVEKDEIEDFMQKRGYKNIKNIDSEGLKLLYCSGLNSNREVANVYAIVHGEVNRLTGT